MRLSKVAWQVIFLFVLACTACDMQAKPPNIIFIFSDDLSYRDLSAYGQEQFETPNLDALATGGLRFEQAYAGSSECAPSRGSLMTGMDMGRCRIRSNRSVRGQEYLKDEDVTVAEVLKDAGYATGFIGKWGIGLPGTEGAPHRQGFDLAYGFYDQTRGHGFLPNYLMRNGQVEKHPENVGFNMNRMYQYNRRSADNLDDVANRYDEQGLLLADGVADPKKFSYSEDLFQSEAVKFIESNKDKPFFLYYATQLPHGPVITPNLGAFRDKPWSLKHKEWAAMMTHLDRGVGKIVQTLEELGIEDDTIIFFAGDNGYSHSGYFGRKLYQDDPLFKNKGPWPKGKFTCTYEGGLRVPFFAYWPGTIKPGSYEQPCALFDFLATAADLAGVQATETDGISLAPTLRGKREQQKQHPYLYWENGTYSKHAQSLRIGDWWAYRDHPSKPIKLFDLKADVMCTKNLADNHPDMVNKIEGIFVREHSPSKWYVNPGETPEQVQAKQHEAEGTKSQLTPTRPNTRLGPPERD